MILLIIINISDTSLVLVEPCCLPAVENKEDAHEREETKNLHGRKVL